MGSSPIGGTVPGATSARYDGTVTCGVYGIFDAADGACLYVGQSRCIEARWTQHLRKLKAGKHRKDFEEWFREHGSSESALRFSVLETCDDVAQDKNALELKWFNKLRPLFYGQTPSLHYCYGNAHGCSGLEPGTDEWYLAVHASTRIWFYYCANCLELFVSRKHRTTPLVFCSHRCHREHSLIIKTVDAGDVLRMLDDGLNLSAIGNFYGTNAKVVRDYMARFGLRERSRHAVATPSVCSERGAYNMHLRWHVRRLRPNADCKWCQDHVGFDRTAVVDELERKCRNPGCGGVVTGLVSIRYCKQCMKPWKRLRSRFAAHVAYHVHKNKRFDECLFCIRGMTSLEDWLSRSGLSLENANSLYDSYRSASGPDKQS